MSPVVHNKPFRHYRLEIQLFNWNIHTPLIRDYYSFVQEVMLVDFDHTRLVCSSLRVDRSKVADRHIASSLSGSADAKKSSSKLLVTQKL
mmetsp:Transcript_106959/g.218158  ORF Transcript_106959/g.218158 Transcript_106959/m.218158 type:complete len:90 (+) Transcript_106959:245-514(+)